MLEEYEPEAVLFSNGPGDPKRAEEAIKLGKELIGQIPVYGICFGHQIVALALGGDTYKLKFGHRGGNQPVKDFVRNRVFITSQNHGFAVNPETVDPKELQITQINANDGTVEGMEGDYLEVYTVQYHPEGKPGPYDTEFFFDMMYKRLHGSNA
jgi:carbamoyl-phosphate synthase small subunit